MNDERGKLEQILEGHRDLLAKAAKSLATKGHVIEAEALESVAEDLQRKNWLRQELVRPTGFRDSADDGVVWPSWQEIVTAVSDYRTACAEAPRLNADRAI